MKFKFKSFKKPKRSLDIFQDVAILKSKSGKCGTVTACCFGSGFLTGYLCGDDCCYEDGCDYEDGCGYEDGCCYDDGCCYEDDCCCSNGPNDCCCNDYF